MLVIIERDLTYVGIRQTRLKPHEGILVILYVSDQFYMGEEQFYVRFLLNTNAHFQIMKKY